MEEEEAKPGVFCVSSRDVLLHQTFVRADSRSILISFHQMLFLPLKALAPGPGMNGWGCRHDPFDSNKFTSCQTGEKGEEKLSIFLPVCRPFLFLSVRVVALLLTALGRDSEWFLGLCGNCLHETAHR